MDKTQDQMVAAGRVTMVPSASGLLITVLDHRPCVCTLRQVSLQPLVPKKMLNVKQFLQC